MSERSFVRHHDNALWFPIRPPVRVEAEVPQAPAPLREVRVVRENHPALAGGDVLVRVEAHGANQPEGPRRPKLQHVQVTSTNYLKTLATKKQIDGSLMFSFRGTLKNDLERPVLTQ